MTDSSDIAAKAREALEGITPGPWTLARERWACIASGADSVIHAFVDMECPNCEENINDSATVAVSIEDATFIAAAPDLVRSLLAALETAETTAKWLVAEEAYNSDAYSIKMEKRAMRKIIDEIGEILQEDPPLIPDLLNRWVAGRRALGGVS